MLVYVLHLLLMPPDLVLEHADSTCVTCCQAPLAHSATEWHGSLLGSRSFSHFQNPPQRHRDHCEEEEQHLQAACKCFSSNAECSPPKCSRMFMCHGPPSRRASPPRSGSRQSGMIPTHLPSEFQQQHDTLAKQLFRDR